MELYCCGYSWIFLAGVGCRCGVKKAQDAAVLSLQPFPTQILQGQEGKQRCSLALGLEMRKGINLDALEAGAGTGNFVK